MSYVSTHFKQRVDVESLSMFSYKALTMIIYFETFKEFQWQIRNSYQFLETFIKQNE